jgi:transposase-like protein
MQAEKNKRVLRKYDAEFRAEVLKMVENGQPVAQIARSLGIGENLIYAWKKQTMPEAKSLTTLNRTITGKGDIRPWGM